MSVIIAKNQTSEGLRAPASYAGTYLNLPDDASFQKNDVSLMMVLKILVAPGAYNDYLSFKYTSGSPWASWNLGSTSADKFYVSFAAGGYIAAVTGVIPYLQSLPATTTINLIATYDSSAGESKLYIDGGTPAVGTGGGATIDYSYSGSGSGPQDMELGRSHVYGNHNQTEYHSYAIWADKVLSPAEVATLQTDPSDSVTGLTHWWKFDDPPPQGTTFLATTGGIDGTVVGSGWTWGGGGPVTLSQLPVPDNEIPASSQVTLTDFASLAEIQEDAELSAHIAAASVILNVDGADLSAADSAAYATSPSTAIFTDTERGMAPASGGGTANFLRADGSFAAPPGGGTETIACCPFGAKSDGMGNFLIANGRSTDADDSTKPKTQQPIAADGTLVTLVYKTKEADTTTVMKVHVNGVVEATVLLASVNANFGGVETISVAVVAGDYVEIEYDAAQKPGECTMYFLQELS